MIISLTYSGNIPFWGGCLDNKCFVPKRIDCLFRKVEKYLRKKIFKKMSQKDYLIICMNKLNQTLEMRKRKSEAETQQMVASGNKSRFKFKE